VHSSYGAAVGGDVLLDGFHAVKHALRFGADVRDLEAGDPEAVLALAAELAPDLLPRLAADVTKGSGDLHGIARRTHREIGPGPRVLLENPRHLGNVGAVVRVAAGLDAAAVLTTGTVDPWHPTVVRAAAGLHFALPVRRIDELPDGPLIAFDPEGTDLRRAELPEDAVLAFGSERHGLSETIKARADLRVAIPMRAGVSSYNLATSVAMALYAGNSSGHRRTNAGRDPNTG
jgi:RNA methyltransferase, TrmH family